MIETACIAPNLKVPLIVCIYPGTPENSYVFDTSKVCGFLVRLSSLFKGIVPVSTDVITNLPSTRPHRLAHTVLDIAQFRSHTSQCSHLILVLPADGLHVDSPSECYQTSLILTNSMLLFWAYPRENVRVCVRTYPLHFSNYIRFILCGLAQRINCTEF